MMKPKRICLQAILNENNRSTLSEIALNIAQGAVCIYPTETIYGIGGRYDDESVYHKVLMAKGRSSDQSMILIGAAIDSFASLHLHISDTAKKCANAFWPGLLTMVLPSSVLSKNIAIRVSNHPFIIALSSYFNYPIFSTSANITGVPYDPDPETIFRILGHRVDFMIDAGILPQSLPSTIIQFSLDNRVTIVREGCIPSERIFAVVNN